MSQSPVQFMYELMQNLDDAPHRATTPSATFALCCYDPHQSEPLQKPFLLVLSNQDGFSRRDLEGICAIGCSSKTVEAETTFSTGEKGIGFKSVFTRGVPNIISTHADAPGVPIHFELPVEPRASECQALGADHDGLSIPFITPFSLTETKRALLVRLAKMVAATVPTDQVDGATYGTVLAIELSQASDSDALSKVLTQDLSPLEFMWLNRIRIVRLASLTTPRESFARTFSYQKTKNLLKMETQHTEHGIDILTSRSWLVCSCDVPEPLWLRASERSPTVSICLPLDASAYDLLKKERQPRVFVTLPTYNEPDSESLFAKLRFVLNAHFNLNSSRTSLAVEKA